MTIAPAAEEGCEYVGTVLDWCGDQFFHHAALLKARQETNVLGVITPAVQDHRATAGATPGTQ